MRGATEQREQQLIIAAAFFRRLSQYDATGVDIGLAESLMGALVGGGERPAAIQYSCSFGPEGRAAGRFLYIYVPEQVRGPEAPVASPELLARLLRLADLPAEARGASALLAGVCSLGARTMAIGFDARVDPEACRVRLSAQPPAGSNGQVLVEGVYRELGLSRAALAERGPGAEIALEYGSHGLADLLMSYAVAPGGLAANPAVASVPLMASLLERARGALVVRSLRRSGPSRLVLHYGRGGAGEAALSALARRSPLAAEFRRGMNRANRDLPGRTGVSMQAWGVTVAMQRSVPNPERFSVLLRPMPFSVA